MATTAAITREGIEAVFGECRSESPGTGDQAEFGAGVRDRLLNSTQGHNSHLSRILTNERPARGAYHEVMLRDWGDGVAEAMVAFRQDGYRPPKMVSRGTQSRARRPRSEMNPDDLSRSVARTRQAVRRKLRAMKADNMCTLVFRENVQDREIAWQACARFMRRLQDILGPIEFVVVAELQKRGAFHFHVGLNRFIDVNVARPLWYAVLRGLKLWPAGAVTPGAINFSYRWGRAGETKGARVNRMIRYMGKYITKAFDCSHGMTNEKRFRSNVDEDVGCRKETFFVRVGSGDDWLIADELMHRAAVGYASEPWYFYANGTRYGIIQLE